MCKLLSKEFVLVNSRAQLRETEQLAVLGAIASIEIAPASRLVSELTSEHMRPVAGMSADRSLVYTLEVSEPVLSLAAHELIEINAFNWGDILDTFRKSQIRISTLRTSIEQVCGQIFFLMAWQKLLKICKSQGLVLIPFVPLLDFLCALLGKPFKDFLHSRDPIAKKMQSDLAHEIVRVNSFVKALSAVSHSTLFENLVRGNGIACHDSSAAHLIIPVYSAGGDIRQYPDVLSRPLEREKVYSALVQVKQLNESADPTDMDTEFSKMHHMHSTLSPNLSTQKRFPISLFLEFEYGPDFTASLESPKAESPKKKTLFSSGNKVNVTSIGGVYRIRASRLTVLDIGEKESDADAAFKRLLGCSSDPLWIPSAPKSFRNFNATMFDIKPYLEAPREPVFCQQK
jgi:hypothetical protein